MTEIDDLDEPIEIPIEQPIEEPIEIPIEEEEEEDTTDDAEHFDIRPTLEAMYGKNWSKPYWTRKKLQVLDWINTASQFINKWVNEYRKWKARYELLVWIIDWAISKMMGVERSLIIFIIECAKHGFIDKYTGNPYDYLPPQNELHTFGFIFDGTHISFTHLANAIQSF
jgi:hypothetical protein